MVLEETNFTTKEREKYKGGMAHHIQYLVKCALSGSKDLLYRLRPGDRASIKGNCELRCQTVRDSLEGIIPEMGVTCLEQCIGPVEWVKTSELLLGVLTR